jgi:single-strand DNA-binding protein
VNDTQMTIVGNLVDEPRTRKTKNGHLVTTFRIASTARRFDRERGAFVDSGTLYVTVTAWRAMARNVAASLHKGQPVVVTGWFRMHEYTVDEQPRTAYELEAMAVGHDLSRGTTSFTRVYQNAVNATIERDESGIPTDDSDRWHGIEEAQVDPFGPPAEAAEQPAAEPALAAAS